MMAMASRRRTAMVMLSTRTAIGSRPTSAFVQHLDPRALDEAELDQPALEFRRPTAPSRVASAAMRRMTPE